MSWSGRVNFLSQITLNMTIILLQFLLVDFSTSKSTLTATTAIENGENDTKTPSNSSTSDNSTSLQMPQDENSLSNVFRNTSAVMRAVYVGCGVVVLVIIYNLVMTRLRRKKTKLQQYGLLSATSENETRPLGQDDDDETTMFDASIFKNSKS